MVGEFIEGFNIDDRRLMREINKMESKTQVEWLRAVIYELKDTASGFREQLRQADELKSESPNKAKQIAKEAAENIIKQYEELEDVLADKDDNLAREIMTRLGQIAQNAKEAVESDDLEILEGCLRGIFAVDETGTDPRTDLEKFIEYLDDYLRSISTAPSQF